MPGLAGRGAHVGPGDCLVRATPELGRCRTLWATGPDRRSRGDTWPVPGHHRDRSPPLAGLVVAGGLAGDDVQPVVGVDQGDEAHQRAELVVVVVLGRVGPDLVADAAVRVGEA